MVHSSILLFPLFTISLSSLSPSTFFLSCPVLLFTSLPFLIPVSHSLSILLHSTLNKTKLTFFGFSDCLLIHFDVLYIAFTYLLYSPLLWDLGFCRCPCAVGGGGGQVRREGVDVRTPALLVLNAAIDKRLEPFCACFGHKFKLACKSSED